MNREETVIIELEDHFSPTMLRQVELSFKEDKGQHLLRMVQAIILSRRNGYFEEIDTELSMELRTTRSQIQVIFHGIPTSKLLFKKLIKIKERQILCGIRDFLFTRQYPIIKEPNGSISSNTLTEYVFDFVKNAQVLTRRDFQSNQLGRVMIQGGHHIPDFESHHHKRMGYGLGLLGFELITGSGPGCMEDPMKGALRGYQMNGHKGKKFIGVTEDGIISGEPCNDYIDHLIVFPDIEKRLEAFIRMSRAGIMLPGGVGTFEEILTFLWIKTHPQNKDLKFPMYFCQPKQSGDFFKIILNFLEECFQKDFLKEGIVRYYLGDSVDKMNPDFDPRQISYDLYDEMHENRKYYKARAIKNQKPLSMLWDWDLYFPEQLQTPLTITPDFVETLRFEKGMPIEELFFSLRSLSSAIVEVNVRNRKFIDQYGQFTIKGDKAILTKLDEIFQMFAREGRMGGREYRCPYIIKPS